MNKVFVFGNKTLGGVQTSGAKHDIEFTFNNFPHDKLTGIESLPEYPVIIIDYDAFNHSRIQYQEQLDLVTKHLIRALKQGSYVVFPHYDERSPNKDQYNHDLSQMEIGSYMDLSDQQIGFKLLNYESHTKLRPINDPSPHHSTKTKNHFFENFLDKWGSSHLYFSNYGDENVSPIQIFDDKDLHSFSKKFGRGRVLYIACQRNPDDTDNTKSLLLSLSQAVMGYRAHTLVTIPEWASSPLFETETTLVSERAEHTKAITDIDAELRPYALAKQLAFKADDEFREHLCTFLADEFGCAISSVETYKEDFTILNDRSEPTVIGEAKAVKGGVTKGAVYQLYNNREEQGFSEEVPGLLVVNQRLDAASWKERDQPVDKKAYEAAAKENILIVRVIDLLRLWGLVKSSVITLEEAVGFLTTNKGWLKIDASLDIRIVT